MDFWIGFVIVLFAFYMLDLRNDMQKENSTLIRALGYVIAAVAAVLVFAVVLYYFFNISLFAAIRGV